MKNNYVLSNLTNLSKFTFYLLLAITLSFNVNCGKKKNKAMFWMAALTGEGSTTGGSGSGGGVTIQTDSNGVPLPGELTGNTNVTGNTSDSGNTSNTTPIQMYPITAMEQLELPQELAMEPTHQLLLIQAHRQILILQLARVLRLAHLLPQTLFSAKK